MLTDPRILASAGGFQSSDSSPSAADFRTFWSPDSRQQSTEQHSLHQVLHASLHAAFTPMYPCRSPSVFQQDETAVALAQRAVAKHQGTLSRTPPPPHFVQATPILT